MEEIERLQKQCINGSNILKNAAQQEAYLDALKEVLVGSLNTLKQIHPKSDGIITSSTSVDNFKQLDSTIIKQNVYDQIHYYLRDLVEHAPPGDEPRDTFIKLHKMFEDVVETKNLIQMQRIQSFSEVDMSDQGFESPEPFKYGIDHLPRRINQETAATLKLPHAITAKRIANFAENLIPTKEALQHIEKRIDYENPLNSIKKIEADLAMTQKELLNELQRLQVFSSYHEDYMKFPPLDVIRETPDFHNFDEGCQKILPKIAKKSDVIDQAFNSLFDHHKEIMTMINEINLCPTEDKYTELIKEETDISNELRRLQFIQRTLHDMGLHVRDQSKSPSVRYYKREQEVFKQAVTEYESGNKDKVKEILRNFQKEIRNFTQEIDRELQSAQDEERAQEDMLPKLVQRQQKQYSQDDKQYQIISEAVKNLEESIHSLEEEYKINIEEITQKHQKLAEKTFSITLFPPDINRIIDYNINEYAFKRWYEERIATLEKENAEKKTKLSDIKKRKSALEFEVESRKEQIELSSKLLKSNDIPKTMEDLKAIVDCPICGKRRDSVVLACGHTFCNSCTKGFISKRNRNCPSCQTRFTQYDIKHFKYD